MLTFAAGHDHGPASSARCLCDNENRNRAPLPPSFVGNNYFCDGDYNGQLWDGQDCTTACCTFNSPPWFSVSLPAPATDNIEVRICTDQDKSDEDIYVGFIQIYVQYTVLYRLLVYA